MDGKSDINQLLFEPATELWRRPPLGNRNPPGSQTFKMTCPSLTWGCWMQEKQLRIDVLGGCWLRIALHTGTGACWYWIGLEYTTPAQFNIPLDTGTYTSSSPTEKLLIIEKTVMWRKNTKKNNVQSRINILAKHTICSQSISRLAKRQHLAVENVNQHDSSKPECGFVTGFW